MLKGSKGLRRIFVAWSAASFMVAGSAAQGPGTPAAAVGKFNGAGSCAASSCHGSIQPKTITRIFQNEYTIWAGQDKHANAYAVLSNPVSIRIGKILKIGRPDQAQKCLVCHSLDVPLEKRARTFGMEDGVSCENCHGPASGWLGPHTTANWPHLRSVELGMYDTRDLVQRSAKCASCHVGSPQQFVDHDMIAAGHPDLTFELGYFTEAMPQHWKRPPDMPWIEVRAWAVSQATQLGEALRRLSWRAGLPTWPEFAEMDCIACHHSLTRTENSWRQELGYPGRRPGTAPWNASRYVVFRHLAASVDPQAERQLGTEIAKITELMSHPAGKGSEIAAAASRGAELAGGIAAKLNSRGYDQAFTLRLLRAIAQDQSIANQGERSAEQAYMSLHSLYDGYRINVRQGDEQQVQGALSALFQQLNDPSAYNAPRFAAGMQRVSALLGTDGAKGAGGGHR
jgi:Cytochrome c554 and c-prime